MQSSSHGDGALRSSTARTSPTVHSSRQGKASTNGRARKCGAVMISAIATSSSAGKGLRSRNSRRSISAAVTAKPSAPSAVTPPQPPAM